MPHSDVRLLTCPEGYKLGLGDDTSDLVEFGEPIEWEAPNGKRYLAYCDLPLGQDEAENVESLLDSWVYEVKPLAHVEPEDEGDEDEDEEDEDDDTVPVGGDSDDDPDSPSANGGPDGGDEDDNDEGEGEPIYG